MKAKAINSKLTAVESHNLLLPAPRRRWALLVIAAVLGGLLAHWFWPVLGWSNALLIVFGLAMLAGVSSFWSP